MALPWPPPSGLLTDLAVALRGRIRALPTNHPLLISARTAILALSLTVGPALLSLGSSKKRPKDLKAFLRGLSLILKRELGLTGFSFAITLAIGGGSALQLVWKHVDANLGFLTEGKDRSGIGKSVENIKSKMARIQPIHRDFVLNALSSLIAILLMQSRRRSTYIRKVHIPLTSPITPPSQKDGGRASPTLDLTLLFAVRAIDAFVQGVLLESKWDLETFTNTLDLFTFWASSARLVCFIHDPGLLPPSYVKWISSLANIDVRLVTGLQALRTGEFSYVKGTAPKPNPLAELSKSLGYPYAWGDPRSVPAYGGPATTAQWRALGVTGRDGVGGIPCEIIHGSVAGSSCATNIALRAFHAFLQAVAIYLPANVHYLPTLLTNPRSLLDLSKTLRTLLGVLRSATFLSTFVSSIWTAVCVTRTTLIARLLPFISHDFYDGPFGCILVGCLSCGLSISIEQGRRRGEIALYVLPKAIRACLPDGWLRSGSNVRGVHAVERLAFSLSLGALLTTAIHRPETLRGLSRWTLAFIMNGGGKQKRTDEAQARSDKPQLIPSPNTTIPTE
ncbi:hypothetical protein OF83DRAFT_1228265 [Amylostereum chailletii]|nr:hypothetical protein OF83DRAFT_1228265 [Amylostereum chailletii]